ncbi:hypothetical protein [Paenibacillus chitinolyticus]|uniref:hypothetical protein n=1 Tax=Paenibacillus chitinolyticus TaxID=79263 RepID=UPI00363A2F5F
MKDRGQRQNRGLFSVLVRRCPGFDAVEESDVFESGIDGEPIDYISATQDIEMIRTTVNREQLDGAY